MNIIISGYGKMGREIKKAALSRNHTILAKFDKTDDWKELSTYSDKNPVVIDFSQPDTVKDIILLCFQYNVPVVTGTTGWKDSMPEVIAVCKEKNQALFTASNFSIGMNLFFAVNQHLASLMDRQKDYDVSLEETHHVHKLDKPSGTAIALAEQIIKNLNRKDSWALDSASDKNILPVHSIREGEIFGDHGVAYSSCVDEIKISHSAKNRKGFAMGAVLAAEWLQGKKGHFEMKDLLGL